LQHGKGVKSATYLLGFFKFSGCAPSLAEKHAPLTPDGPVAGRVPSTH